MIKRISQSSEFLTGREKTVSAMYWPMRPETPPKPVATLSQERQPQSLHSMPQEKRSKGEVH
jgi:hypothetical protein